ncbi:uncharacterized protein LOC132300796 [Cornus florida]|uniref:uncharacterized protein LOC132300796 n=1 Tax=Cornus florida TaxID=4283 RepID=UPI00289D23B3|nr:uncharacterized protein LOC132300796 [Cornus florida]
MAYYARSRTSSILEVFTLNPLPYPVLLLLALITLLLGIQWFSSYEEVVETTEQNLGWVLFVIPVLILIAVRWLSTIENPERFFVSSPYDRQRRTYKRPSEGSSPWGVAAFIVLLLILVQYQSTFHDSWFV